VLLKLPSQVVGLFAPKCLGYLPKLYRKAATIHTFKIRDQCGAAALELIRSASSFKSLADVQDVDGEGAQAISRETFRTRLSEALRCMGDILDDHEIHQVAAFCFEIVGAPPLSRSSLSSIFSSKSPSPALNGSVNRKQFQQTCLLNEDIDLASMAELFDENRSQWPLERFFTESAFSTNRRDMMSPVDSESL